MKYLTYGIKRQEKIIRQVSLRINPQQIDARLNLGIAYFYEGRLKESADEFRFVLKLFK